MPKHGSIILYVHGNQKARFDGQLRTATSTLTQLLNYDRVGGQLRGDKECPFGDVSKSGRVWRKVPESYAERCESRGGRPGLPFLTSLMVSVDAKQY